MANIRNERKEQRLLFIKQTTFGQFPRGEFKCICGTVKEYDIAAVKSKNTCSCGCLKKENDIGDRTKTHGLSRHPLYSTWRGMIRRCYNPNDIEKKYYNGISVCQEWRSDILAFIQWALGNGWKPGMRIDKDEKGGMEYSPQNCIIVTPKQNSNKTKGNHIIEYMGVSKNVQQWSEHFNISHRAFRTRLKRGWSMEEIIATPVNTKRYGKCKR